MIRPSAYVPLTPNGVAPMGSPHAMSSPARDENVSRHTREDMYRNSPGPEVISLAYAGSSTLLTTNSMQHGDSSVTQVTALIHIAMVVKC
jgi:hypothetical protein